MGDAFIEQSSLLSSITDPIKSMKLEAVGVTGMAYAKSMLNDVELSQQEEDNFRAMLYDAWKLYVMAMNKTTLLNTNTRVIAFSAMQWSRRLAIYERRDRIDTYLDLCISNGWMPSINGFLHFDDVEHEHSITAARIVSWSINNFKPKYRDAVLLIRSEIKDLLERMHNEND